MTTCRAPREDDVSALSALRNDLPTQYALLADPQPNSDADVRAWLRRRTTDPSALFFVIADDRDAAVGFTQVVAIDARSRHGTFGIAVGSEHRGRGHGRAALAHVLDAARADGRMDKLVLHVAADNPACALYRAAGFRDVGVHRRHYRGAERWHDVAIMERFFEDAP
ncbi:MAG TPA: GNAT family protein [Candidatus Elarobacter sp.]|nr:GNAT family protein [Candidatus Elarobacter sp.]